jgi:hypothetical protein
VYQHAPLDLAPLTDLGACEASMLGTTFVGPVHASLIDLEELPGAKLLVPREVRLVDEASSERWKLVRDAAFVDVHEPIELLVDLGDFVLEPNAIGFWGPGEREFMARRATQVVRFGVSPFPLTSTLIEVAGRRYGFPANLAVDRSKGVALMRSLR